MKLVGNITIAIITTALMGESQIEISAMQQGEKASSALVQKLGGELKAVMQKEGPVAAVNFCSQNALTLTHQVSKSEDVKIKRTTLQQRNPVNKPSAEEIKILNAWNDTLAKGEQPAAFLVNTGSHQYIYYKPLLINNDVCLKCHGTVDEQSPLGKAIKAAYPNDRATGYKMGDLRGMIVVDIPVKG